MIKANITVLCCEKDEDHPLFVLPTCKDLGQAGFKMISYDGLFAYAATTDGAYVVIDDGEHFWVARGTLEQVMARINRSKKEKVELTLEYLDALANGDAFSEEWWHLVDEFDGDEIDDGSFFNKLPAGAIGAALVWHDEQNEE